jgi:hypothetical protein
MWICPPADVVLTPRRKINARFYRSATGTEPVRDWLRSLSAADGFVKKTQRTPNGEIALARKRKKELGK